MEKLEFPKGFLWGSATSSHQIEGNNHNDWSEWEKSSERIEQLKKDGGSPSDFISGRACDSYNRFEEDFDIAKSLNHNIHRISIEWSRIESEEGKFNNEAIQHYKTVVKAIRDRGMEPMVTLWHFTNPIWFASDGGFLNKKAPLRFVRFVRFVVENLKDDVSLWITFNEAVSVYGPMAYISGTWPPQKRNFLSYLRFRKNIIRAHTLAYNEIKNIYHKSPASEMNSDNVSPISPTPMSMSHNIREAQIGVVENNSPIISPWYWRLIGLSGLVSYYRNHFLLSGVFPYYDFIGLNYYCFKRLPGSYSILPRQDSVKIMDWEIYPKGIYDRLLDLKRKYNKPIYITENGIADDTDEKRTRFIKDHLYWVWRAIQDGVNVRGYMYWSLLDNFEWHRGYGPRFGLVEIDYKNNQTRKIRTSAYEYARIISNNGFEF